MLQNEFQYYAELESTDGRRLGDVRLDVDWIPALRWAEFEQTVRSGNSGVDDPAGSLVEPVWSSKGKPPYVCAVQIGREGNGASPLELSILYFFNAVSAASTQLVESGVLEKGQLFEYKIYALANEHSRKQSELNIDVVPVVQAPDIDQIELAPIVAQATLRSVFGSADRKQASDTDTGTLPVFIPKNVLDEATAISQSADNIETGGVLVGKLCRDPGGVLFLMVTAQIPAEHTTGTLASLRLTPETWVSVDAAIKLRNRREIALGWWHCHPFFCRNCTPEMRAYCKFSVPAFSAADRDVHREVFQQPWSIALLLSFLGDRLPSYDLFAWNRAQIEAVDFFTLPDCCIAKGRAP